MRRRSSLEPYNIDNEPTQTLNEFPEDELETNNGLSLQPDSKRTSCIPPSHHAPVGHSPAGWTSNRLDDPSGPDEDDDYAADPEPQTNDFDPASITVQMSIWQELCAGHPTDQRQSWTNDATLCWRRYPYSVEDECSSPVTYCSPSTAADEEVELVTADPEREHEERRILERFASFPSANKSRPVSILLGGGGGGAGGSSSTPKSGRRRNKRKGCDSPRSCTDDNTILLSKKPESPASKPPPIANTVPTESTDLVDNQCHQGQGQLRQLLCLDLQRLQEDNEDEDVDVEDDDEDDDDDNEVGDYNHQDHRSGNEPVTSHGMRPARGWASMNILPDDDEEDVTVSPRVLSPEMDEPAGSFHVRGFHGRCKEPQEKRTAFIALGNLNNLRSSANRLSFATDEHPATLRAKQLVQQIHGLKQKIKLYEDAFEQRYGYRPSHHQKMDDRNTKRVLTELARTRKELKQLKERYHLAEQVEISETTVSTTTSSSAPSAAAAATTTSTTFSTTLYYQERPSAPCTPSVEETVLEVQEQLANNRQLAGRSEAVETFTGKQILDEKLALQRALLYVESIHGRPASFKHKDLLRPLYSRYRMLKRMVSRSGLSRSKEDICDLAPILEYETLELSETRSCGLNRHSAPTTPSLELLEGMDQQPRSVNGRSRHLSSSLTGSEQRKDSNLASWNADDPLLMWKRQKISLNIEENLHALPLNQLMEQLRHVREEKRRLRRAIRDLEADVLRHQGAARYSNAALDSVDEDGDEHLEPVYAQYRHARAKLRLLEALVAKHDGSATL